MGRGYIVDDAVKEYLSKICDQHAGPVTGLLIGQVQLYIMCFFSPPHVSHYKYQPASDTRTLLFLKDNSVDTWEQSESCIARKQCKKLTTNVGNWLFQSLPQRDFVVLAARTPDRGDSTSAAGGSLDKEWVTEHARQVDNSFPIHTLWS